MTKQQFDAALKLAQSNKDLTGVDDSILDGCGLPNFQPVTITLGTAAKFLRWHVITLTGGVDSLALNEMRSISRKRWLVCGE